MKSASPPEDIEEARAQGLVPELTGCVLIGADLAGLDLSDCDLEGQDLSRADLTGARLSGARMGGALLYQAVLNDAELLACDLKGADLTECKAHRAVLGHADLSEATLFGADLSGASMTEAKLVRADLRGATLRDARVRDADLRGALFDKADLRGVDLGRSLVARATFTNADLRGARLRGLRRFERADWVGTDIREIDFTGGHLLHRYIRDQNYLYEFRNQGRLQAALYGLWWLTSDCGRSVVRWFALNALVALVFAGLYMLVDMDWGEHRTALSPLYYSFVTLTTLGYGDVVPASAAAQALATAEVILGYLGLGGMLSILATKMARRAD